MDEERIKTLVSLLLDKDESEITRTFEALGVPNEEREETRRRLSELKLPPKGLPPEELPENGHFRQLVPLTRRGKAIFFVGAGVSVDAGMPSTGQLLDALRAEVREFKDAEIPPDTSFTEAARIVERIVGRQNLVEVLRREFMSALKAEPPPYRRGAYRLLPALPRQFTQVVLTTNWDDLLSRAFEEARESTVEILEGAQLPGIPLAEHAIVKLHGGFEDPERMVITEADYAVATSQIARRTAGTLWGYVASLLSQYSFIFIGYNLTDPDFRLLRRMVEIGIGARPAPHFFVAPLSRVDEEAASRWADILPIPATATSFLLALFRELDQFSNRQDELDLIFRYPSLPFIEFYGPFGSGKTDLLDAAERQAQAEGWLPRQIVRVNWDRRRDGRLRDPIKSRPEIIQVLNKDLEPPFLLKRLEDFGDYLRDKKGGFLIFDATERVQNQRDLVSLLSEVVAPAIQEMNERGQRSKLLLAGRYPLQGWPYSFRRSLLSHALTPFDASVVLEMAQKFLLATDPDSQERFESELITDILEISSGHAGFIKTILVDLMSEERRHDGRIRLPRRLMEEEKREYVSRFNKEIDQHVPWEDETQKEVYEETLSVFRWLNREMVRELNLPFDPFPGLTAIYVLSPDDFSSDQVIRRTKMFRLRYEQPRKFVQAHERAQGIFATGIERLVYPIQLDYILEWLFHTAYLLITKEPGDAEMRRKRLIEQIGPLRYRAHQERVRGEIVGAQLVRRITEEDRELWDLLEECVREEGIEEILMMLERKEVLDVG